MNQVSRGRERGAARHWVIGCGGALALFILVMGIGGYIAYRKISQNVSMGTFDTTKKTDPALTAAPDQVLPLNASGFTRESLSVTPIGQPETSSTATPTSGVLTAIYRQGTDSVTVMAVPTAQAESATADRKNRFGDVFKGNRKPEQGQGVHVRMAFGPEPVDMALWSGRNWTYWVQTTQTQSLPFAEKFEPEAGEGEAAPQR